MAEARAVVDIVGIETLTDQLLEEIGLFVGALGRTKAGHRLAAIAFVDCLEAGGCFFKRLFPRGLTEIFRDLVARQLNCT